MDPDSTEYGVPPAMRGRTTDTMSAAEADRMTTQVRT
jgi:hypothetical protein